MDTNQFNALNYAVQRKIRQINRTAAELRFEEAFDFQRELFGMIEIVKALGYTVEYAKDESTGFQAVCTIKA